MDWVGAQDDNLHPYKNMEIWMQKQMHGARTMYQEKQSHEWHFREVKGVKNSWRPSGLEKRESRILFSSLQK